VRHCFVLLREPQSKEEDGLFVNVAIEAKQVCTQTIVQLRAPIQRMERQSCRVSPL
jgi:hypothetical protein